MLHKLWSALLFLFFVTQKKVSGASHRARKKKSSKINTSTQIAGNASKSRCQLVVKRILFRKHIKLLDMKKMKFFFFVWIRETHPKALDAFLFPSFVSCVDTAWWKKKKGKHQERGKIHESSLILQIGEKILTSMMIPQSEKAIHRCSNFWLVNDNYAETETTKSKRCSYWFFEPSPFARDRRREKQNETKYVEHLIKYWHRRELVGISPDTLTCFWISLWSCELHECCYYRESGFIGNR